MQHPFKDYYEILELSPAANATDIKSTYRRLAKRHHPDVGGDPASFRAITEAYEVLIDPDNRERYDRMFRRYQGARASDIRDETIERFWEAVQRQRATWQAARAQSTADNDSNAASDTSGATRSTADRSVRGDDVNQELKLPFKLAVRGGAVRVEVQHLQKQLEVKVPAGIQEGSKLVLKGKGMPGQRGASSGNLILKIAVDSDPDFHREGKDLLTTLTVNLPQLMLGSKLQVQLFNGDKAELELSPGTQPGGRLRLEGMGIPYKDGAGDLVVEIKLLLPPMLTPRQRKIIENFSRETGLSY